MTYRAIGLMSGSSLDGLDIVFAEFVNSAEEWTYEIKAASCLPYSSSWKTKLENATTLSALDYQLLDSEYGHYCGKIINQFIEENNIQYQVGLIGSHGHTIFHIPSKKMTAQLGRGAAIAAETKLPVVSDLRSLDVAFGGQGAPIVPIGEKYLFKEYGLFLNLGGIANISLNQDPSFIAFDVCAANQVLNMLSGLLGKEYDAEGQMASKGNLHGDLLHQLNSMDYYLYPFPKSLSNDMARDIIFPLIRSYTISVEDGLRTYVEHIAQQISLSVEKMQHQNSLLPSPASRKMLVTGGGAFNSFLIKRLSHALQDLEIEVVLPADTIIRYKEALIMAFIALLRWRQQYNVLSSVTGAATSSIGGAVWIGQEA
ncbi:MAG: anhydro-N-acetylmuramic acid kinase [Flavisolibacter sp.]